MVDPYRERTRWGELEDKVTELEDRTKVLELFHQGREKCSGDMALDGLERLEKKGKDLELISVLCLVGFLLALAYAVFFKCSPPNEKAVNINYVAVEPVECPRFRY